MADDDDDTIYVDIVPKLDDAATEKETGKLRDKFKSGAKGIGEGVGKVLHSELARELDSALSPYVHDWAMNTAADIGASLGDGIKDFAKGFGVDIDSMVDKSRDLAKSLGVDEKSVHKFADAFKDFKDGSIEKAIDDLAGALKDKLPKPLADVMDKTKKIDDNLKTFKDNTKDVTDALALFTKNAPGTENALRDIGAAATDAFGPFVVAGSIIGDIQKELQNLHVPGAGGPGTPGGSDWTWDWFHPWDIPGKANNWWPFTHDRPDHNRPPPAPPAPPMAPVPHQFNPGTGGAIPGVTPGAPEVPYVPGLTPAHTSGFSGGSPSRVSFVDFTAPAAPTISGPEDLPGAGASVANLYRFAQSLVGTPYSQKLRNDCSGMVSELASVAVGLPAPGAGGRFTTVNEGQQLAAMGFRTGIGGPNDFSVGWYDHGGGNFGHTAATLPGGINAESGGSHGSFLLGPGAAGASSPQFDHHMFLPMGPESTLGAPPVHATLTGYGIPNTPAPGMPGLPPPALPGLGGYPPPPTQGNTYSPAQPTQLGHGSGVGVSGGIIGLAEQAGAMAAGAMSFGGGAIAAQIAEQEINLAVQKGGQAAAVLAKAPMETFGLHGGQMGAPSTGQGGWISKILGGFIGQQFSLPNTAGAGTQAPKQPQKQQDDDGGPGGKSGTPAGPAGTREDPHYTKIVGGGQVPQGGLTSAMTTHGIMSAMV